MKNVIHSSTMTYRLIRIACFLIAGFGGFVFLRASSGIVLYTLVTVEGALGLLFLKEIHALVGQVRRRHLKIHIYSNLIVAFCSIMLVLTCLEAFLALNHRQNPAEHVPLTIPDEWKYRDVDVEGAKSATYWHEKLHVYDEVGMRRTTPFPPKQPDMCRIMVVGDSLTYGKGVGVEETYPAVMEAELSQQYRVEVLNLGRSGYQSEEILQTILRFTPQLTPDIIVYGVCLNDFLETGEGQRTRERRQAWLFPLPQSVKEFLIQRTLSGKFFEKRYDEVLMRFGLRADFYGNILANLYGYQLRFTRDVTAMNYFAVTHGLPPIVAMTLDQRPVLNGRGHQVARLAETIMTLVGMVVISTEDYYTTYDGRNMSVSPWEGHPNAEAHRIFARTFAEALRYHPVLQPYER